ncbi:MAG: hypothetical protein JWN48_3874 [Myxococcaceae bacterium]|nr:hypothetical protein [Myxococcaceae bacterium]
MLESIRSIVKRACDAQVATLARVFSRRARLALCLVAACQLALLFGLSWARFSHVHQRTFDLALYARIAWGLAHGDLWAPVVNSSALGCHLAPILWPLGLLGRLFGTVPVLLVAQALAIALCVFPIARIGARRLGTNGIWLAVAAFVLYPNLFHVGSYEFHPGTLAVLPMTWAFDALDRADVKQLAACVLAVLLCREDLGAFCVVVALVLHAQQRDRRALYLAGASAVYTLGALAIVARFAPEAGSLSAHFGHWGGSPLGVLRVLVQEPARVVEHFRARLMYLPQVLAPLSFFSLRAARLLLPAAPYLLLNMLSAFPTADEQYSHYLTPAVPALIVSGIVGVTEVRKRFLQALWFVTLGIAHFALGGSPLSRDFDWTAYRADEASVAAKAVLARIPDDASVQAPDALLPHLAERHDVRRAPPPETGSRYVVLDVSHRLRYAHQEVLLRTSEEPLLRSWLARPDYTLVVYQPPYALFAKSTEPHVRAVTDSCLVKGAAQPGKAALTSCLSYADGRLSGELLRLTLQASGPCRSDMALRFGPDAMPARVELLCGGALAPSLLRRGDVVRFDYRLSPREAAALRERGLWLGTLRASGAPVEEGDLPAVAVPLAGTEENP